MLREPTCDLFFENEVIYQDLSERVQDEIDVAARVLKSLRTFNPVIAGGCFISWADNKCASDIDVYFPRLGNVPNGLTLAQAGVLFEQACLDATKGWVEALLRANLVEQKLSDPVQLTTSSYGVGTAKTERGDHIEGVYTAMISTTKGRAVDFDIIITKPENDENTVTSVVNKFDYQHCRIGMGVYKDNLVDCVVGTQYWEQPLLLKNEKCLGPFRDESYVLSKINKNLWGSKSVQAKVDDVMNSFFKSYHLQTV